MAGWKANCLILEESLAESNRLLNLAEQIAHVGHWRVTLPGYERVWSAETYRIFGLNPALGVPPPSLRRDDSNGYHPDDRDRVHQIIARAAQDGEDGTFEARVVQPNGAIRNVIVRFTCETRAGAVQALFGVLIDATERHAAKAELQASEARYRLLAEHTSDVVIQAELDSTRLYVSPASERVLGYLPDELVGTSAHFLLHPDDVSAFDALLAALKDETRQHATTRQRYRRKNGAFIWAETSFSVLYDDQTRTPKGYIASIRDISERHEAETKSLYAACHDPLTGLHNRLILQEHLENAFARSRSRGESFALHLLDLNRFKAVNDSFGHPFGDRLLQDLAIRLRAAVHEDDLVARMGGDEFAILQHSVCDVCDAERLANRIVATVNEPLDLGGDVVNVGVSIGIALGPRDGDKIEMLTANADLALYKAKQTTNGICVYEPGLSTAAIRRLAMELELKQAIRTESLCLHYQPVIDLETDRIVGAEALVRWPRANGDVTLPGEFIPLAESSGLIIALGAWVLHESCRAASAWDDTQIAVNVSACQFAHPGLEATVTAALERSGLDPRRLELEVTESVLMNNADDALAVLHRLRDLGVRTVLDDFGTGFSSLRYIQRFPFDRIKIDRSFVQAMDDERARAVVELVTELARKLGMITTAEGVETSEHLEHVRAAGCRQAQGYLFGRPSSLEALESRISCRTNRVKAA